MEYQEVARRSNSPSSPTESDHLRIKSETSSPPFSAASDETSSPDTGHPRPHRKPVLAFSVAAIMAKDDGHSPDRPGAPASITSTTDSYDKSRDHCSGINSGRFSFSVEGILNSARTISATLNNTNSRIISDLHHRSTQLTSPADPRSCPALGGSVETDQSDLLHHSNLSDQDDDSCGSDNEDSFSSSPTSPDFVGNVSKGPHHYLAAAADAVKWSSTGVGYPWIGSGSLNIFLPNIML